MNHQQFVSGIEMIEAGMGFENTQRDVKIALINELAMIFSQMGIGTLNMLEAADSLSWTKS